MTRQAFQLTIAGADEMFFGDAPGAAVLVGQRVSGASGGELIEIEQLDELPQRLKGETATIERHHEATIWDNWLTMLLLIGFYCTDVGIRRLMGLL